MVQGDNGNDTIWGASTTPSRIHGGAGNEAISGGTSNDVLWGGDDDTISGGWGDRVLQGGEGNDDLRGDRVRTSRVLATAETPTSWTGEMKAATKRTNCGSGERLSFFGLHHRVLNRPGYVY